MRGSLSPPQPTVADVNYNNQAIFSSRKDSKGLRPPSNAADLIQPNMSTFIQKNAQPVVSQSVPNFVNELPQNNFRP